MEWVFAKWFIFGISLLYTVFLWTELWSGRTTTMKHTGFFETVGGVVVLRSSQPVKFWLCVSRHFVAVGILWMLFYLVRQHAASR